MRRPVKPTPASSIRRTVADWSTVVAVAVLIGAALTFMMATRQGVVLPTLVLLSLISLCFAIAYVAVYRLAGERLLDRTTRWWQRLVVHVSAVVAATLLGSELALLLMRALTVQVHGEHRLRVTGVGFAVLSAIRLLQLGYEGLRQQVREGELRSEQARRQTLKAELAALEARTDPHFLFNSLNTVAGLIEEDPDRAVEVVTRLGGYFRHHLEARHKALVPLGEELAAAASYLEIQGLRFAERLSWTIDAAPEFEGVQVPPMVLQPLVENAVTHGTSHPGRRTRVTLRVEGTSSGLLITVEDDGPGPAASGHQGAGTSLADLRERLQLIYDGRAAVSWGAGESDGFRVRLELPDMPAVSWDAG